MNILYILGNGFDLNLGLKTSYSDFYEYYQSVQSEKSGVNKLKNTISENYKNWSDLELALGEYTEKLTTLAEFDEVFDDIREHLNIYLKKEEEKFDITTINQKRFLEDLVRPEIYLPPIDKSRIISHKPSNIVWNLDIVTFNYTTIIDRILDKNKNTNIGFHANRNIPVSLKDIVHIHGNIDKRMILGVNDLTQLKNKGFHNNIDITEALIKDLYNKSIRQNLEKRFQEKINNANIICIFGSSIGDTDNIWWQKVGEKLKTNTQLIIFTKGEEIPEIMEHRVNRKEREMKQYFFKKTDLTPEIQEKVAQNIYVSINSQMFKNIFNPAS